MPIILLFRHPFAFANSYLKSFQYTEQLASQLLEQEDLTDEFLLPFVKDIKKIRTPFEDLVFLWCILYFVPLSQFSKTEIHVAFYENFCLKPKFEIDRLFSFLKKEYDQKIFQRIDQPSPTALKWSAINKGVNLLNDWRKNLSLKQIKQGMEIISIFGLDKIYSENLKPQITNVLDLF